MWIFSAAGLFLHPLVPPLLPTLPMSWERRNLLCFDQRVHVGFNVVHGWICSGEVGFKNLFSIFDLLQQEIVRLCLNNPDIYYYIQFTWPYDGIACGFYCLSPAGHLRLDQTISPVRLLPRHWLDWFKYVRCQCIKNDIRVHYYLKPSAGYMCATVNRYIDPPLANHPFLWRVLIDCIKLEAWSLPLVYWHPANG